MSYYTVEVDNYGEESFEIFFMSTDDCNELNQADSLGPDDYYYTAGYYYAYGLPGYLHDSEPFGPYSSESEAYDAAVEQLQY